MQPTERNYGLWITDYGLRMRPPVAVSGAGSFFGGVGSGGATQGRSPAGDRLRDLFPFAFALAPGPFVDGGRIEGETAAQGTLGICFPPVFALAFPVALLGHDLPVFTRVMSGVTS
jgi:hypothetical protein